MFLRIGLERRRCQSRSGDGLYTGKRQCLGALPGLHQYGVCAPASRGGSGAGYSCWFRVGCAGSSVTGKGAQPCAGELRWRAVPYRVSPEPDHRRLSAEMNSQVKQFLPAGKDQRSSGSRTVMVVPAPDTLDNMMVLRCISTILFVMERPSQLPYPWFLVAGRLLWCNGQTRAPGPAQVCLTPGPGHGLPRICCTWCSHCHQGFRVGVPDALPGRMRIISTRLMRLSETAGLIHRNSFRIRVDARSSGVNRNEAGPNHPGWCFEATEVSGGLRGSLFASTRKESAPVFPRCFH